ncbi:hypothetical protein RZS08_06980, partial [Arthrospira platensis SPKY1]|nr:hypothetical protein [Arthrospira platensis SPKY1]
VQRACAQRRIQRLFLHNRTAADVDEHAARRQQRQLGRADQAVRVGGVGQADKQRLRARQQVVQRLRGVNFVGVGVGCGAAFAPHSQHGHAQRPAAARHAPADVAVAQHERRLAVQQHGGAGPRVAHAPVVAAQRPIVGHNKFCGGQEKRQGQFGHGGGVVVQVVDGDVGKFTLHQVARASGQPRPGDDERVEVGVGGELVARGPAADENVEIGRCGNRLTGGDSHVGIKLRAQIGQGFRIRSVE